MKHVLALFFLSGWLSLHAQVKMTVEPPPTRWNLLKTDGTNAVNIPVTKWFGRSQTAEASPA